MTRAPDAGGNRPQVEAFLRSSVPAVARERQEALLDRLDRLAAEGRIEYDVHTWEKRVPLDDDSALARERYDEFAAWARECDARLRPFFDTRECYSWTDGREYEALVTPVACLAVYWEGDLRGVYPHADGDRARSIDDCLSSLEGGVSVDATAGTASPSSAAD